jgi:hypothetical protein
MACANCETFSEICGNCRAYGHLPCKGACAEGVCQTRLYCYKNTEIDNTVRVFDEGLAEVVIIEAHDAKEANEKAKNHGIRFVAPARDDPEPNYLYIGGGLSIGTNAYSSLFVLNTVHHSDPFNWGFEPSDGLDAWTVSSPDEIQDAYILHKMDGSVIRKGVSKLTKFEYEQHYCRNPTEFAEYSEL